MASITFWARGDSTTANNNELNPIGTTGANGVPAFQLTFYNDDPDIPGPDTSGDLTLDGYTGLTDPDTMVEINGVRYAFTFTVQGTLPTSGQGIQQVPLEHRGDTVGVIRVVIDGVPREYFFILDGSGTQASMNAFGDGAISLTNIDFTPCFCTGTQILTPYGNRRVETLVAGDWVAVAGGSARQIVWIGSTRVPRAALSQNGALRPIVIRAGAFGPGLPEADLSVSPQHRILVDHASCELLFGEAAVLIPAKYLVGTFADTADVDGDVVYYHVLLEDHAILVSNGLPTESFQPARHMIDVMDMAARLRLEAVIAALGAPTLLSRKDACRSLRRFEAEVLLRRLPKAFALPGLIRDPSLAPLSQT